MNNDENTIEIHLRALRKERRMSQEELADALGLSRQSIIAIETGKYLPSLPVTLNICKFFNSPFESLFSLEGEDEEEENNKLNSERNNIINQINQSKEENNSSEDRKENIMSSELEPWRPFREMVSLRDAMDRLFEDSFITPKGSAGSMPKIDIKDKKDHIEVIAELPGMTEDDVEIEVSEGVMTISGEKKEEKVEKEEGYYYKESHSGTFSRSFTLPAEVVEEKADAEMKNGILSVMIPKVEPKKATKVKISPKKAK